MLPLSKDHDRLLYLTRLSLHETVKIDNEPVNLAERIKIHQEMWEAYHLYNASLLLRLDEEELYRKSLTVQEEMYPFNRKLQVGLGALFRI